MDGCVDFKSHYMGCKLIFVFSNILKGMLGGAQVLRLEPGHLIYRLMN